MMIASRVASSASRYVYVEVSGSNSWRNSIGTPLRGRSWVPQQASRQRRPRVNSPFRQLGAYPLKRFETRCVRGGCGLRYGPRMAPSSHRTLLGLPLEPCSTRPLTGFFRTGCCETDESDVG